MTEFVLGRNRDAWFVIRGYKYQIDLTILRWLSITDTQVLALELGEDIDIVSNKILRDAGDYDRELEQVKHLDKPISLRSSECKAAIANAIQHFTLNPSQNLIFRFCTNSSVTTERPPVFHDRTPGIEIWESIRTDAISEPTRTARLSSLLDFLRRLEMPKKGIDQDTWNTFTGFLRTASVDELARLVERFEWTTGHVDADNASAEIVRVLQKSACSSPDEARRIYPRLFLHVSQLLSRPGKKTLDTASLSTILALPTLSDADARLLTFLNAEVISQAERLEQIELAAQRHENAIAVIRQRLLEIEFGPTKSLRLSTAIAAIATSLPPQVKALAERRTALASILQNILAHEWFAIYGSIGCGKTQLASLLGGQIESIVYMSLRDLTSTEANFLLHHLFLQLCDNSRTGSITTSGLTALEQETVIILDDVPRLTAGDQLSLRLIQIADSVGARHQTLVTLSHFPVPPDVVGGLHNGRFAEVLAPRFDRDDIKELFERHGAPKNAVTSEIAEAFLQNTLGHPTVLAALARIIEREGWDHIDDYGNQDALIAAGGDVVQEAMFRLLQTVENDDSRELLYRLCVILGAFGAAEIRTVSDVAPCVSRPNEAFSSLVGLWIERQSDNLSVVCPLIAQFGSQELASNVEQAVASALADLVFDQSTMSPIDFAKAITYLHRAKNGASLGMHLLQGLESVKDLPIAWQKLIYLTTVRTGLLDDCPTVLALLIKAKQVALAYSIGTSVSGLVTEAQRLIEKAQQDELWGVVGYAVQAAPLIARDDFDEALRLCGLVLNNFGHVIEFRREFVGELPDCGDGLDKQYESSFPWYFVSAQKNADDFMKWFGFLTHQPTERCENIFASDLAGEGFKIALDRLWMIQHELPAGERTFDTALAAYDAVIAFCETRGLRLFSALAVRARIIVLAEYFKDLPKAVELADTFLAGEENSDEVVFLINEAIGRQYLYARHNQEAIERLSVACALDTGTFDGLRCRAFIELSRAIGDDNCSEAFMQSENAVLIAKRNRRDVSDLDMVSSLGEAAIAAGWDAKYDRAFEHIDAAFALMSHEFDDTVDWKMRCVLLGNSLGYLVSMAGTGKPPASDYAIPRRGSLIGYNEAAARWYDESNYGTFDLAPTLLATFANVVGRHDRAIYWATKGIDEARTKGVLACVYPLAEMLIPTSLMRDSVDQSLDYAYEASTALIASSIALRTTPPDIRKRQDVLELLGPKPSNDWNQAEQFYLFIGVIPALLFYCVRDNGRIESLQQLLTICATKATNASNPGEFTAVAEAIDFFLANEGGSTELHEMALQEKARQNPVGMAACYLLSSFSGDADLKLAVVQHALVLQQCSSKISERSILWNFLTDQLCAFWRNSFNIQRFRFSAPSVVQGALQELSCIDPKDRAKQLVRTMFDGLSIRLPPQLQSTLEWLHS